jgi:poly-gamma-glutamate synthesis protein (capsule biosynthesis protein)
MTGQHRRPGSGVWPLGSLLAVLVLVLLAAVGAWAFLSGDQEGGGNPTVAGSPSAARATSDPPPSAGGSSPPSLAPSPSSSPSPDRGRLVIHGTGDVNLDPDYIPAFHAQGFGWAWSGLDGLFRGDDLTVINLECVVSNIGTPEPKEFTFRGPPEALASARDAGVEVANLGNNHAQDFGVEAMLDTRRNLVEAGIAPVGAGKDISEAMEPAVFDLNGWRVAVLGFGGVVPTDSWLAGPGDPGMASGDHIPTMVASVRAADRLADLVIVAIHWGVELDVQPRPEDVERAHAMIDAGADAIFGHHSHRLNPMGSYKGRPIFWSLGNFVWPSFSVSGSTTAVGEVVVAADGSITGRLIPAYIESSGHPVLRG